MKPAKIKYKDEEELMDEYCSRSECHICEGTDMNGEPNGFGCNGADNFVDSNQFRLTSKNVICNGLHICKEECEHGEEHECNNDDLERACNNYDGKICKCIDIKVYELKIKPSRYRTIQQT